MVSTQLSVCPSSVRPCVRPSQVDVSSVKAIAAGGAHSAFLQSGGALYMCGANNKGQLGKPAADGANALAKVQDGIASVDCGSTDTAVVTTSGKVMFSSKTGFTAMQGLETWNITVGRCGTRRRALSTKCGPGPNTPHTFDRGAMQWQ